MGVMSLLYRDVIDLAYNTLLLGRSNIVAAFGFFCGFFTSSCLHFLFFYLSFLFHVYVFLSKTHGFLFQFCEKKSNLEKISIRVLFQIYEPFQVHVTVFFYEHFPKNNFILNFDFFPDSHVLQIS